MQPQDLEPEMEALLHRMFPRLDDDIEGASEREIDKIRSVVGHELPRFYEWFLRRMGRSMGPLAAPCVDYTAKRVLWCYEQGLAEPDPDNLLIGYDSCENHMDLHYFYDFSRPCRADAMIARGEPDLGPIYPEFETFREALGWGKALTHVVRQSGSFCGGIVQSRTDLNAVDQLKLVVANHGFDQPLPTGSFCGIFMSPDMTMTCYRGMMNPTNLASFKLGGQSQAWLRRFLGDIFSSDELELGEGTLSWGEQW